MRLTIIRHTTLRLWLIKGLRCWWRKKTSRHLDAGGMLINLLLDPGTLRTMSQMAHTCARPDAASKVAQGVLALCRQS